MNRNRTKFFALIGVALLASAAHAQTAREIAQQASPSVVLILAEGKNGKTFALGSGFFIGEDVVATNSHVIQGAARLYAKLSGRKGLHPFEAVIANDGQKDLALLRIRSVKGSPLSIGSEDEVRVGDQIYVVGNPEGLESTFSSGNISGIRRMKGMGYLQISAPVSHGSSGGPVLNKSGGVVGVVVGSFVKGQNLNFAVPVFYLSQMSRVAGVKLTYRAGAGEYEVSEEDNTTAQPNGRSDRSDTVNTKDKVNRPFKPYTSPEIEKEISDREQDVRKEPQSAEAQLKLAETYRSHYRKNESIQAYNRTLRLKPDYAAAYYGLAESYRMFLFSRLVDATESQKQTISAIEAYKGAIRIKTDYVEAHVGLGKSYSDLERYGEAIDAFKVALRINPKSEEAYDGLGWTFEYLGRPVDAVHAFERAVLINPSNGLTLEHVAQLLSSIGRVDEAIVYGNKAIRTPTAASVMGTGFRVLAEMYVSSGRIADGIANFTQYNTEMKGELGSLVDDGFRPKGTLEGFERVERKRKLAYAYCYIGFLHVALGDKASALEQYKTIKSLGKDGLLDSLANDLFNAIYK